nr:THxN family PEP-CTERM protein [Phenylobacterium sp.]
MLAVAAAVLAGSIAVASPAAAGVVVFSNVSGAWSNPAPGSGISIVNGSPTSTATWGTPTVGSKKSSYSFTGNGAVTPDLGNGDSAGPFQIGEFQHNNWPITGTSLTSIKLAFKADITVDSVFIGTKTFDFIFTHDETPNGGTGQAGTCAYGGVSGDANNKFGCSDKVTVNSNSLNNIFSVGSDTYTLEIAGFFAGGNLATSFLTKESGYEQVCKKDKKGKKICHDVERAFDNKAGVMASVSMVTSAVPEPSTWAMMIIGFGGVGSMLRANRRRLVPVAA